MLHLGSHSARLCDLGVQLCSHLVKGVETPSFSKREREIEEFIIRQPTMGEKDDYDSNFLVS